MLERQATRLVDYLVSGRVFPGQRDNGFARPEIIGKFSREVYRSSRESELVIVCVHMKQPVCIFHYAQALLVGYVTFNTYDVVKIVIIYKRNRVIYDIADEPDAKFGKGVRIGSLKCVQCLDEGNEGAIIAGVTEKNHLGEIVPRGR